MYSSRTNNDANTYNLLFDTGSANDAVAGPFKDRENRMKIFSCAESASCQPYSTQVAVEYGSGKIS